MGNAEPGVFTRCERPTFEDYGWFVCPGCRARKIVDEDQAKGRAAMRCADCGWQDTRVLEKPAPNPVVEQPARREAEGRGA